MKIVDHLTMNGEKDLDRLCVNVGTILAVW